MKTERRHELQTNVLAERLTAAIEAAEPYYRLILAGIIAVIVVIFAYVYLAMRETEWNEKGWDSFFVALNTGDPAKLTSVAENFANTRVSEWARLMSADLKLNRGIDLIFKDKADGRDEIKTAADMYQTVLAHSEERATNTEWAKYGLARVYETLGELTKAREEYNAIVKDGGPYAGVAAQRVKDLDRTNTKDFYDWFAKYEPVKPSEKPDAKLDFLNESLERSPDLSLPKSVTDRLPGAVKTPPKAGDTEIVPRSGSDNTSPATETPAESAPADSAPSDNSPSSGGASSATEAPATDPASGK